MNSVVNIPIPRVTAKPFIGPDPRKNKIIAAISVVIFASKIVVLDFVYPASKAIIGFFSFLVSSLIRSKIKTFASTAIPTVKIIPAIPGKVNVASNKVRIPINKKRFETSAKLAINPNAPVSYTHLTLPTRTVV